MSVADQRQVNLLEPDFYAGDPDFRLAPGAEPELGPGCFTRTLRQPHIEFTPA